MAAGGGTPRPDGDMDGAPADFSRQVTLLQVTRCDVDSFVEAHYLGKYPAAAQLYLGVFYEDVMVGMLIYGSPTAGASCLTYLGRAPCPRLLPWAWVCWSIVGCPCLTSKLDAGELIVSSIFNAAKAGPHVWQCGSHRGHRYSTLHPHPAQHAPFVLPRLTTSCYTPARWCYRTSAN